MLVGSSCEHLPDTLDGSIMADLALSILISDSLSIVEYVGDSIELHPSDNHFDCIVV